MSTRDLIVIVMVIELGLHYFPWRMMLGKKLPRLASYTLGSLGMMVPLSAWLMDRNEIEILQIMWMVVCAAGLMVFALYGFDHYLELERSKTESAQREKVTIELLKGQSDEQSKQA